MDSSPVSRRLRQARLATAERRGKALSQRQLGIEMGLDESVASVRINQYEQGVHAPNFDTLNQLARVLDVPVAFFYAVDDDLADIILKFSGLSKKERKDLAERLS